MNNKLGIRIPLPPTVLGMNPRAVLVDALRSSVVDSHDDRPVITSGKEATQTFIHLPFSRKRCCRVEEILSIVHVQHWITLVEGRLVIRGQIQPYSAVSAQGWHVEGIGQNLYLGIGRSPCASTSTTSAVQIFPAQDFESNGIAVPVGVGSIRSKGPGCIPFNRGPRTPGQLERKGSGTWGQGQHSG